MAISAGEEKRQPEDPAKCLKNEKEPVRVLHVLGTLNRGGAESRIMDLYRAMDRTAVQFDFLIHADGPQAYEEEAVSLGAHVYRIRRFKGYDLPAYKKALRAFFMTCPPYVYVEGHMTSTASIYLPEAKKAFAERGLQLPETAAHLRSSGSPSGLKGILVKLLRKRLPQTADELLSCARQASRAVYGDALTDSGRVEIIPNAIRTEDYRFDASARTAFREDHGIPSDAFVIGHVGRFDSVKNQPFLIAVLKELKDRQGRTANDQPLPFLLFVGGGKGLEEVRALAEEQGVSDRAVFAGECDRARTIAAYQAMDVFVLPSFYEGLPGTVIEAEAAGLPCILSDTVTEEVCIVGREERISIDDPGKWAQAIASLLKKTGGGPVPEKERMQASEDAAGKLDEAGYNVRTLALRMKNKYMDAGRRP